MDRKHGKYIVNIEHSGNQPPFLSPRNHEAHNSACQFSTSTEITGDVGTNLIGVCTSPATLEHSEFPNREFQHYQAHRWKELALSLMRFWIWTFGLMLE
ncbi:dynactin-associated protein-like [Pongo pygmaeus]|uniref:dynactin-associated protein-like n=1 Tax=Pongo pygmaeus TaxID=9600 RepID=UPI00300C9421